MILKQIESIMKNLKNEKPDEQYAECAIYLKDNEDSLNFIADLIHFKCEVNDTWLLVEWNGGDEETGIIMYSHCIKISEIVYVTSEV